ncbi:MAG: hypothetical protein MUO73_03105, partial [Thermoplasmata archaeon]|nr:hypothetical protein [Thermoplasmata archaeon]
GMQYNECEPHTGGKIVNLPPGVVTAIFHNPGPQSYWQTALSNVPGGYDVANGLYVGWCVNEHTYIVPGLPYTIHLMSSYDAGNPWPGNHGWYDWPCVNWIINNKDGYTPGQIQDAIWYFVDGGVDPGGGPTHILIQAALANGQYFVPSSGQHVAVLCIGDPIHQNGYDVQHTFIEVDP